MRVNCFRSEKPAYTTAIQLSFFNDKKIPFYMDHYRLGGFPGGSVVKNPPAKAGDAGDDPWFRSPSREDPLKEKATHSSILAWEIPWTEEPGELRSTGLQSNTAELLSTHTQSLLYNQLHIMYVHMYICDS